MEVVGEGLTSVRSLMLCPCKIVTADSSTLFLLSKTLVPEKSWSRRVLISFLRSSFSSNNCFNCLMIFWNSFLRLAMRFLQYTFLLESRSSIGQSVLWVPSHTSSVKVSSYASIIALMPLFIIPRVWKAQK